MDIDKLFQSAIDQKQIPGVVAIVGNREKVLYHKGFGKMDSARNVDMHKDAIFRIASMTKPITAVAFMALLEQGRLSLDDPVSEYIPSLKKPNVIVNFNKKDCSYSTRPAENEITIWNMLTHTSGIGYSCFNHTLNLLRMKTGRSPRDLPLLFEPGSRWMYGEGYWVLGEVIERITGKPLDVYFKDTVFDPLGMNDTFFAFTQDKYSRLVTLHCKKDNLLVEMQNSRYAGISIDGSGGLYSTATDYLVFLQMLLNRGRLSDTRIISEESIEIMTQNQINGLVVETLPEVIKGASKPFPLGAGRDKFSLGFQICVQETKNDNMRSSGSYSWMGAFNTFFWVDPKNEIAAVILMQMTPLYDESSINVCQRFEELVYRDFV